MANFGWTAISLLIRGGNAEFSLLTMVDGLPKNWIGTLPSLCSKTGHAANTQFEKVFQHTRLRT